MLRTLIRRRFSGKKQFDYQAFEEDIRQQRQRSRNQGKPGSEETHQQGEQGEAPRTM
jgi:hypothetical protein